MIAAEFSNELIDFMKALGSKTRMNILIQFLDGQERSVGEIVTVSGLGQPSVSEHLMHLKRAGILTSEKRGQAVFYRTNRANILKVLDSLAAFLRHCC